MLTSTLPRFKGDMQANFVGEQAQAWTSARPDDKLWLLAPHDAVATKRENQGQINLERFAYMKPESLQKLAYPAILPNIKRNPLLAFQVPFFLASQYRAARKLVAKNAIDMIYAHWVMPQGVVAWLLKKHFGIPYVLQNHSSDLAVFGKFGKRGRDLARAIIRDANHFFCVNSLQRDEAASLFEGKEKSEFLSKCTVLPMGVVIEPGQSVAPHTFDVGTIGRLSAKKGIHYLIEAGERLAAAGIRPIIAIAGDGEEMKALKAMPDRADIRFLGFVTSELKEHFFAQTARFAFPAKEADGDVEGLPVSLLEALCRGMPVLASRDTNIELLPEWPELKQHVVFVEDPSDNQQMDAAFASLLSMPHLPNERLIEVVARYRWDRLIEFYLSPIETSLRD